MSAELCLLSIREASELIRRRELSPVELTEAFLGRIAALEPKLHVFVRLTDEAAREEARRAEAEVMAGDWRGPLHGIPIGLKDIYATRGVPTTAQSKLLLSNVPTADAETVRRLREAGAVCLGKLATHEFAIGGPSHDLPFPLARNPWNTEAFTGGSSTGSGAGVAAGLVMGALGSDSGGSIRTPASFCGITGLKPSYGRVSRMGVVPLSYSFDHCGPMAWRAEDAALMLEVIAGHDPTDPASADVPTEAYASALREDLSGLRVGVVRHFYEHDHEATGEVRQAIDAALAAMESLGAEVEEVRLSPLDDYYACCMVVLLAEAFCVHADDLRRRAGDYGEIGRQRIMMGAFVTAADYVEATRLRRALRREVDEALARVDVLVTATTFAPAPRLDEIPKLSLFRSPYLTAPFNVSGHPAVAVRCGFSAEGLPLSLQIAGRMFDEATVLAVAHAYERATPWAGRRPEV